MNDQKKAGTLAHGTALTLEGDTLKGIHPPDAPRVDRLVQDARTGAARTLREYLAAVRFRRMGPELEPGCFGPPIEFKIPKSNIHVEWPDGETPIGFPSISILAAGQASYQYPGMGPKVQERLRNLDGTAFTRVATVSETLVLEVWTSSRAERRCILAGLEHVMSPNEERVGLHLWTPEHYGVVSRFLFVSRELFDDDNGIRNRRRARVYVAMTVPVMRPIRLPILQPSVGVMTDGE